MLVIDLDGQTPDHPIDGGVVPTVYKWMGGPIAPIPIQATNFGLRHHMIQQVQNTCQFHGLPGDDANRHIDIRWFNKITSTLKYKNVPHDAIKLMLFLFSLEGATRIWLEKEPSHSILTWEDLVSKFQNALKIIENKSKVRTSRNKPIVSKVSTTTSSSSPSLDVTTLTEIVKELVLMNKANQQASVKAVEETCVTCVTCGGPHPNYKCLATDSNTFNASAATGTYNQGGPGYHSQGDPNYHASNQMGPPDFPSNVQNNQNYNRYNQNQGNYQVSNNHGRGQNFNQGNNNYQALNFQAPNFQAQVGPSNENEFKSSLDTRTNKIENQNNQIMNMLTNLTMQKQNLSGLGSLSSNTIANPRGDVKAITTRSGVAYDGPTIPPTSSPLLKEVEREPEVAKDKKLSLLKLTPTRMTLELANRSVTIPVGVAEDVFVKVRKFYFLSDFVVVDYDVDPRVPLILERPFLRTARALIDVHGEELTLRVNDEAITFKLGHTSRYSRNYYDESANQIDVIDVTCEEYAQEVLGFLDSSKSGNPTPSLDPIITTSLPSLTPFEGGDFILEEIEACLTSDSIPPRINDADFDPEGDIRLLEKLLNDDSSSPLP
ncbi:reverse transcriptase domain-containing protein, partial [Tanacetum coccineum]